MTMHGWQEDQATDVRTRDLEERQRQIMRGRAYYMPPQYTWPSDMPLHAHPRRIDWLRVAALTGVILAACAAAAALIVGLALFLTAF